MVIEWKAVLNRLNRLPGFSATTEHVALFKDLYEQAEKECDRLNKDCEALRAENSALKKQLATCTVTPDLVDVEGLLWKKTPLGAFESKPRCPNCSDHPVMSQFPPGAKIYWLCSRCQKPFDFAEPPKTQ